MLSCSICLSAVGGKSPLVAPAEGVGRWAWGADCSHQPLAMSSNRGWKASRCRAAGGHCVTLPRLPAARPLPATPTRACKVSRCLSACRRWPWTTAPTELARCHDAKRHAAERPADIELCLQGFTLPSRQHTSTRPEFTRCHDAKRGLQTLSFGNSCVRGQGVALPSSLRTLTFGDVFSQSLQGVTRRAACGH